MWIQSRSKIKLDRLSHTTGSQKEHPSTVGNSTLPRERVEDFTAVVSSLQVDDVSWLNELNWDVWKYEVDNPNARFKTPINKGSEAMVYLT